MENLLYYLYCLDGLFLLLSKLILFWKCSTYLLLDVYEFHYSTAFSNSTADSIKKSSDFINQKYFFLLVIMFFLNLLTICVTFATCSFSQSWFYANINSSYLRRVWCLPQHFICCLGVPQHISTCTSLSPGLLLIPVSC